jgi:hypothetical protein
VGAGLAQAPTQPRLQRQAGLAAQFLG